MELASRWNARYFEVSIVDRDIVIDMIDEFVRDLPAFTPNSRQQQQSGTQTSCRIM